MEGADRRATPSAPIAELIREAAAIGVVLTDAAITRFQTYIETLLLWRSRLSLTGAATAREVVQAHICDSLTLCRFIRPEMRVADLGSGAGFPGIPLAIACDGSHVTLVESRRKKANFLREVVRRAALANVEVTEERAERLVDHVTEPWDIVVSRAVWKLSDFLDVSERLLVAHTGIAIAMKGSGASAESAVYTGPLLQSEVIEYRLATGAQHRLLVYRKP
jgi:16S rRNA (guanine527-N7)-methyltransferase